MSCKNLSEWLENADNVHLDSLPSQFIDHIKSCEKCNKKIQLFKKVSGKLSVYTMSNTQLEKIRNNLINQVIIPAEKTSQGNITPNLEKNSWIKFSIGSFVVCLIISLYFYANSVIQKTNESEKHQDKHPDKPVIVHGNNICLNNSEEISISSSTPRGLIVSSDKLVLAKLNSNGKLFARFEEHGNIEITGEGELFLKKDGFESKDADFTADFNRSGKPFVVRTPQVRIEIIGTTIKFKLKNGEGEIRLLKGCIEYSNVTDEAIKQKINPGQSIIIKEKQISVSGNSTSVSTAIGTDKPDSVSIPDDSVTKTLLSTGTEIGNASETKNSQGKIEPLEAATGTIQTNSGTDLHIGPEENPPDDDPIKQTQPSSILGTPGT
ncbi:MAG: hypothetical protein HQM10_23655 [Candidatus Riflebacteria bacterium]|nr:hypothetical protein [Candidatus Riflebacteria bacterium]